MTVHRAREIDAAEMAEASSRAGTKEK
jgi:hypothetical protein